MKKLFCGLLAMLMISLCLCVGGCTSEKNAFVGKYDSVFVDSQNDEKTISFSLEIRKDNTFTLGGHRTLKGTWRQYTESGEAQLLCVVEEGYAFNTKYPNAWSPYFFLTFLDDGTLMATSGTTSSSTSVVTAFGKGDITLITLILFERQE
jgi:hypothetical protein